MTKIRKREFSINSNSIIFLKKILCFSGATLIVLRHFSNDDIVDVKVLLQRYIDEIQIGDIEVKSHTCYKYQLNPQPDTANLIGLKLLMKVLSDVGRFIDENTVSVQLEDD